MTIQVLGTGCPTCKKLFELTERATAELGLGVKVEYINDIEKIMAMGVMSSPILAIDNQPVVVGLVPSLERIKELLFNHEGFKTAVKDNSYTCGGEC